MKKYSIEDAFEISNWVTNGASVLISAAVTLVVGTILFKLLWGATIPELFPAAVSQGFILGEITWLSALKFTALVAVLMTSGSLISGRWRRQQYLKRWRSRMRSNSKRCIVGDIHELVSAYLQLVSTQQFIRLKKETMEIYSLHIMMKSVWNRGDQKFSHTYSYFYPCTIHPENSFPITSL